MLVLGRSLTNRLGGKLTGMKVLGINHIGIAPKDPAKANWFFKTVLGVPFLGEELVTQQKTNTFMYDLTGPVSDKIPRVEILENRSSVEEPGPIAKFLEKKGGGVHHIAVAVDNINEAIATMKAYQVELVDENPKRGAHNTLVAFVHPRSTGGILVELVQEAF